MSTYKIILTLFFKINNYITSTILNYYILYIYFSYITNNSKIKRKTYIFTVIIEDRPGINIPDPSFRGAGALGDLDVEVGEIDLDKIQLK